jgi:hypothetical protein
MPATYGLDQPMPDRYVPQLLYPFVRERRTPAIAPVQERGQPVNPAVGRLE